MTTKGSNANAVQNNVYTDLEMTRYPEHLDAREGAKLNLNMMRWTNLKDYNMAEHINAVQDAILAVQRTLGQHVQIPANPVDAQGNPITDLAALNALASVTTVGDRLDAIEQYDWYSILDKRYGGPTWAYSSTGKNATIQEHRHLGSASGIPGSPEKIVLTEEVTGLLPKANVNLTKTAAGITGSDIFVEASSPEKISEALNDKISETTGGQIHKDATLEVLGKMNTRWTREFDHTDASTAGNTVVADGKTLLGRAISSGSVSASNLLEKQLTGMYHGRYVAIVRLSSTNLSTISAVEISAINTTTNAVLNSVTLKGSDFDAATNYKSFFLIFNHDGATKLRVRKLNTNTATTIKFDYAIVEPVHPAVFDR